MKKVLIAAAASALLGLITVVQADQGAGVTAKADPGTSASQAAPPAASAKPAPDARGDAAAGKKDAVVCAGCHGPDGNSLAGTFPKLAGQHYTYLLKQLRDFKAGRRTNPIMSPMAATLTPQAMKDVAAYFSSQKIKPGHGDPALAKVGEKLYRGGNLKTGLVACSGCHGPEGHGNPLAVFPALRSQQPIYLETQLKNWRDRKRTNDPNGMMATVAAKLTNKEINELAQYITDLR